MEMEKIFVHDNGTFKIIEDFLESRREIIEEKFGKIGDLFDDYKYLLIQLLGKGKEYLTSCHDIPYFDSLLYEVEKEFIDRYLMGKPFKYESKESELSITLEKRGFRVFPKVYNFKNLLLQPLEWKESESTLNGVRGFHPEHRNVFKCKTTIYVHTHFMWNIMEGSDLKQQTLEFLRYEPGCFIAKHVDRLGLFTVLIFPKEQQSTGGELILYDNGNKIVYEPSKFKETVHIVFPSNMEHEVLPVVSGQRYVFKITLTPMNEKEIYERKNPEMD